METRDSLLSVFIAIGLSALVGCDGIVAPPWWTHQVVIYAALNPDSTRHAIVIAATDPESTLLDATVTIHRRVESSNGDDWELVASWDSAQAAAVGSSLRDLTPCRRRVGSAFILIGGVDQVCMTPEADLEPGGVYRVEARTRDRETASGITRVVGGFEVEEAVLSSGGNSAELSAEWTPSLAAHRYILSLRKATSSCINCADGWHADVDTTSITIEVPEEAIEDARRPITLDVVAFDVHLHAFLTTGHSGLAFSVPPVQNVVGGFGVVGSLRSRERRVDGTR